MRVEKKGMTAEKSSNGSEPTPKAKKSLEMMNHQVLEKQIDDLFENHRWSAARKILETALLKDRSNHWILTQIGVTFYEQRKYQEALGWFERSQEILGSCPLTLWNLAGTYDSLGRHKDALQIYVRLLRSDGFSSGDPCWESEQWTSALKTDCAYRSGLCFEHLRKPKEALFCYWYYLKELSSGFKGMYSFIYVWKRIRRVHQRSKQPELIENRSQEAFDSTLAEAVATLG